MSYESNANYAMILLEDTGIRPQDRLDAISKQVAGKLTKEINAEIQQVFWAEERIDPTTIIQGIEERINEETKKLLGVHSLNPYLISGRVDHDMLSMEYKVIMHMRPKWMYKGKHYDLGVVHNNDGTDFARMGVYLGGNQ